MVRNGNGTVSEFVSPGDGMQMVWWVTAEGTHIMERMALQASRPGRRAAELSIWNAGSRVGRVPGLVKEWVRK